MTYPHAPQPNADTLNLLTRDAAHFWEILDASGMGFWEYNHAADCLTWGSRISAMLGLADGDFPAGFADVLNRIHAEDRTQLMTLLDEAAVSDHPPCAVQFRMLRNDGQWLWVQAQGRVAGRDAAGRPLRTVGILCDIDERKRAEALNLKLASIIEASSDLIATSTPEGRVDYMNQAGRGLLGIGAEASLEQTRIEDYHPAWAYHRVVEKGIPAAMAQGQWLGDNAMLRHDGAEVPVSQLIIVKRNQETGQAEFLMTICRDISERLRGEQALRRLQQEHELILDSAPALIWYKDTHNCILRVNAPVAKSLGLTKEEIEGRPTSEFYPEEAERYYQDDLIVAQSGQPRLGIEEPYQLPSGEKRWVRTDKIPLKDDSGRVTRILVMAIDITASKQAETALRASENRFRIMADSAPVLIWMADTDKRCVYFNQVALDFRGRSLEQEVGNGWIEGVHPDDFQHSMEIYVAAFDARQAFTLEFRLRRFDGEYRWIIDRGVPRYDDQGVFLGYIGSCVDITERKQAEERLRESDRHKDEFLAILAHELRNPLAPIRNGLQILRRTRDMPDAAGRALDLMERQLRHMVRLIDDLLDLSRINLGKIELQTVQAELADILQDAVETSRPLFAQSGHELRVSIPDEPIMVEADLTRLAQAFTNLLNNAVKYTGDEGCVILSVERQGQEARVRVRDNGMGIPAEMLSGVFDLFSQANPPLNNPQGGLGIGLNLVKRLVELHGGTVEARSEGHGKGSEFIVRLPVLPASAPCAADSARLEDAIAAPFAHRILVVDDNEAVAEGQAWLLEIMGHQVRVARDGLEAIAVAAEFRPELILLDIGMPILNGYDACRRIRAEPWGRDMVIVALTGWGQDKDKESSREAGFDRHLVKPVDPKDLERLIDALPKKN